MTMTERPPTTAAHGRSDARPRTGFATLLDACGLPADVHVRSLADVRSALETTGRASEAAGGASGLMGSTPFVAGQPLLLSTALADLPAALAVADLALATSGRALVLVHADPAVDRVLTVEDQRDPLVSSSVVRGIGIADPLVGLSLSLADAVALDGHVPLDAKTLVTAVGRTVVALVPRPTGSIVVVGTDQLLHDRWLAAGDVAAFVAWAMTSRLDTAVVPALVKAVRPGSVGTHVPPAVVRSPGEQALLAMLPPEGVRVDDPAFSTAAGRGGRLLSAEVHDALVDFMDHGHPSGALLLKGLPVGDLPATPPSPRAATVKDRVSELVLLTVARRLGQPIGYAPEHSGELVQNLVPTASAATSQTSTSSAVELEFHTEAAFHPHKPRFLLLLCLRSDPFREARTLLCSIDQVLADLPLAVRHTLTEPRFRTGVDESYTGGRSGRLGRAVPVLAGDPEHPTLTFDADLMVGTDAEAQAALEELRRVVKERHIGVALEAGDLLVVDNDAAVHGRSSFRARYDGTDRWLQRTFVVADLAASAADRHGRVVTTRFTT